MTIRPTYYPDGFDKAESIEDQARLWFEQIYTAPLTDEVKCGFRTWLSQSEAHTKIYHALEQKWRDLALIDNIECEISRSQEAPLLVRALSWMRSYFQVRPTYIGWGAAGVAMLWFVVIGAITPFMSTGAGWKSAGEYYQTMTGENRQIVLSDGSQIHLGPQTRLYASFNQSERRLTIEAGQAFFDISSDPTRPLQVDVGSGVVQVLGTSFDIRRTPRGADIVVAEGRVAAFSHSNPSGDITPFNPLTAGQSIRIERGEPISAIRQVNLDTAFAWREGRLSYANALLEDVIADINRYRSRPIRLMGARTRDIRVTTAFNVDEHEQFLELIAQSYDLDLIKQDEYLLLLK